MKSKKALRKRWVFAGSSLWTDPKDNKNYYQGDVGDFICVSNFPTATLDLPISSTSLNDELMFEANTEKIPPVDTQVRLVFQQAEEGLGCERVNDESREPSAAPLPHGLVTVAET